MRPRAVVNASPLIFLAKLDRLDLLPQPAATTPEVLDEVGAGLAEGHPEALSIRGLVDEGQLMVEEAGEAPLPEEAGLDLGERTVLQLARTLGVEEVVVDDRAAIRAAKLMGLRPVSTPFLMLRARRRGELSAETFQRLLDRLIELRYFLSPRLYQRLLDLGADENADDD